MTTDYLSINTFIERYNSTAFPGVNYTKSEMIEWAFELLRKIGTTQPLQLLDEKIDVINHRAKLPLKISRIVEVKEESTKYPMSELMDGRQFRDLTYVINSGYLVADFENGAIILTYYGWPVDDSGYPKIPNEQYYISAVESYLLYKMAIKAWTQRKISLNEVQELERNSSFYIMGARNNDKMPSFNQFKSFRSKHNRF
jgi:hypothetical protein